MRRYEHSTSDYDQRYRVVDDTLTTWAVEDTETGDKVGLGLTKFIAEKQANEYNEAEERVDEGTES